MNLEIFHTPLIFETKWESLKYVYRGFRSPIKYSVRELPISTLNLRFETLRVEGTKNFVNDAGFSFIYKYSISSSRVIAPCHLTNFITRVIHKI